MIENYLERLTQSEEGEITPLVKSLSDILKGETSMHREGYADYLERKYK